MKRLYLSAAILGTLMPWTFFGSFIAAHGLDVPLFIRSLFANNAAGGFSADVLISICVFWVWSWKDARDQGVARWWWVIPAGWCVGLSLAMPLYFWLREGAREIRG